VWGGDDLSRFLSIHGEVKKDFLPLLVTGDLIAELLRANNTAKTRQATTIRDYLATSFAREADAQLDQAGEVTDAQIRLDKIFIDINALPRRSNDLESTTMTVEAAEYLRRAMPAGQQAGCSTLHLLLSDLFPKLVLIAGPGAGKSTLGQYLAQLHRGAILSRSDEIDADGSFTPTVPRIPFRVAIREFAQWLTGPRTNSDTLDVFIAEDVHAASGRSFATEDLHELIEHNPTLLILDGLDEVMEQDLRTRTLNRIVEFLQRSEQTLGANLQVVATSRPTAYADQFNPRQFLHLQLVHLTAAQISKYVTKWISARTLDRAKATRLQDTITEYQKDPQVSLLTGTPLQVTILILIILSGGTPPRQREALFNEYLEVIYKRERAKLGSLVKTERQLLINLHAYIAYVLHRNSATDENAGAYLSQAEYERHVFTFLRAHDPYSTTEAIRRKMKTICREAGERFILIVEARTGYRGFELRSIQEFLAAMHICDTAVDTLQRYKRLRAIVGHPHWRNATLFFAGRVGRMFPGEMANIVEVCKDLDLAGVNTYLRPGCWLALELSADQAAGPNRAVQRSLIEYGLELLQIDPPPNEIGNIGRLIDSLPRQDIKDHVLRTLNSNVHRLRPSLLLPTLEMLHWIQAPESILKEGLEAVGDWERSHGGAPPFIEALRLLTEPAAIAPYLTQAAVILPQEEVAKACVSYAFPDAANHTLACWETAGLRVDSVASLLNHFFHKWWRLRQPRRVFRAQKQPTYEFSGTVRLVALTIRLQRLLATRGRSDPRPMRAARSRKPSRPQLDKWLSDILADEVPMEWVRSGPPALDIGASFPHFHLQACLWVAHFRYGDPSPDSSRRFRSYVNNLEQASAPDRAAIRSLLYGAGYDILPAMAVALQIMSIGDTYVGTLPDRALDDFLAWFAGLQPQETIASAFQSIESDAIGDLGPDGHEGFALVGFHICPSKASLEQAHAKFEEVFGLPARYWPLIHWNSEQHLRGQGTFRPSGKTFAMILRSVRSAMTDLDAVEMHGRFVEAMMTWPTPWTMKTKAAMVSALRHICDLAEGSGSCCGPILALMMKVLLLPGEPDDIPPAAWAQASGCSNRVSRLLDMASHYPFDSGQALTSKLSTLINSRDGVRRGAAGVMLALYLEAELQFSPSLGDDVLDTVFENLRPTSLVIASQLAVRVAGLIMLGVWSELDPREFDLLLDGYAEASDLGERQRWLTAISETLTVETHQQAGPWLNKLEQCLPRLQNVPTDLRVQLTSGMTRVAAALAPEVNSMESELALPLGARLGD
jgi:hypothetical protein